MLPLEFTEAGIMDCSIPETPQHFANASPESQAKDERKALTPSASASLMCPSELIGIQSFSEPPMEIGLFKPLSQKTQMTE